MLGLTPTGAQAYPPDLARQVVQSARLRVLPPVAQVGPTPASPAAAETVLSTGRQLSTRWGDPLFADGFDGETPGPAWQHRIQFYNPWGGRGCSTGDPSAVAVTGGDFAYRLNGHVSTQDTFDFRYGVAAARIKFQRSRGQHGAFWLQPRGLLEFGPTPWGAEIDAIEWYGESPEFVILSLLSSDFELRALGGEERLPQHMDVDWVPIWPPD